MKKLIFFGFLFLATICRSQTISEISRIMNSGPKAIVSNSASSLNADILPELDLTNAGYKIISVDIAGTWSGTITFQGRSRTGTWYSIASYSPDNVGTFILSTTANGHFNIPTLGFDAIRIRMTSYSSGTATSIVSGFFNNIFIPTPTGAGGGGGGSGTQYLNGAASGSPTGTLALGYDGSNLRALKTDATGILNVSGTASQNSSGVSITTTNITANNQNAFSLDLSSTPYRGISVQITGTWNAILNFQGSNDNSNWVTLLCNTRTSGIMITDVTTNDLYNIPCPFRYIRLRSTSYTSGTAVATAYGFLSAFDLNDAVSLPTGNGTAAAALRTVLATDQGAIPVNATLQAGSVVIGKVSIDQTTPGTTNKVDIGSNGTVIANAGANLNTSALALDATLTNRAQLSKITDGTNDATVKAASTAAGATDKALVVAISPNNTVASTQSGTWTVQPGNTANTTAWKVDGSAVIQPVSGSVTANIGSTNGLALDATLTGGTVRTKITDGTNNAAVKAASTAAAAADPSLVVSVSPNNSVFTNSVAPLSITASNITGVNTNVFSIDLATAGASYRGIGVMLTGTWSAILNFQGSNDNSNWVTIMAYSPGAGTNTANLFTNDLYNVSCSGMRYIRLRCTSFTSGTVVPFVYGYLSGFEMNTLNLSGSVSLNGTSAMNVAQINGVTPLMGNGVTGTGSQRVTIASDNTAFAVNNTQQGTASQNVAQVNGVTTLTGNGVTGTGSQRVTIASDNTAFSVNATPPTLTKGTQGSTGYSTQDLKDAGRTTIALTIDVAGAATSEALATVTESRNGATTSTFTSKTITNGKRIRFQHIAIEVETLGSGTAPQRVYLRLRVNTAGATTASSPLQGVWACVNNTAVVKTGATQDYSIPDGLEFTGDGTATYGLTLTFPDWVVTTATVNVRVTIIAFEY